MFPSLIRREPEEDIDGSRRGSSCYLAVRIMMMMLMVSRTRMRSEERKHPALAGLYSTGTHPTHIEIPESCLPLRKRVRFASPTPSHEVGESSAVGGLGSDRPTIARDDPYSIAREDLYGFVDMVDVPPRCSTSRELDYDITDTWDDLVGASMSLPDHPRGSIRGVTALTTIFEQETTQHNRVMIEREARWLVEACRAYPMDASDMTFRCYVITYYGSGAECIDFRVTVSRSQETKGNFRVVDIRPQETGSVDYRSIKPVKYYGLFPARGTVLIYVVFCLATQYRSSCSGIMFSCDLKENGTKEGVLEVKTPSGNTRHHRDAQPEMAMYSHTTGYGCQNGLISNCTVACQVKFATCTLQGNALTWWNSHVKTTTPEAAHAMPWRTLKKMMTDKYCPRGKIKKLEFEMWNLKVKGNDVVTYSQRFQELELMCAFGGCYGRNRPS
ncbi:reverse transcriptase domain-containing protein [Tanacetum coccineum]